MQKITLYQFPISHFCEKIRWALDFKKLDYQAKTLLPGLHLKKMLKLTGQNSVPVIKDRQHIIHNSKTIIDYLEKTYSDIKLNPIKPQEIQQANAWEDFADNNIGPQVRVFMYHYLLDSPEIVIPFFTKNGPWYGPQFVKFIFPKLQTKMRRYMKINQETAQQAKQQIHASLDKLNTHLNSRGYLVSDTFSRADLSTSALLAPLFMPEKYGLKPVHLPHALRTQIEEFDSKLSWAKSMYANHR